MHLAQVYFGFDVLAALDDEDGAVSHWQVKRDGSKRGLVEVIDND
jgi:hypothetical protein